MHKSLPEQCDNCICKFIRKLEPGTIIRFAQDNTDTNFEEENFKFVCFNDKNCCVTLLRIDSEVGNGDTVVYADCSKIAAVEVVQD